MLRDLLAGKSNASFVEYGYGQVEPNHLSAQRNGQIYAQLPAQKDIEVLEQGQFVKYNYAEGVVDFAGPGEWMLVYNETKLYREHQNDCEFALVKDNYQARVYSPYANGTETTGQTRFYNGVDADGNDSITLGDKTYKFDDVTAAADMYELHYNEDPFHITGSYKAQMMPENGSSMVPRVFKTMVGDIFTTNTINIAEGYTLKVTDVLTPGEKGILEVGTGDMEWQVVKVYTMPDGQKGAKVMRIK